MEKYILNKFFILIFICFLNNFIQIYLYILHYFNYIFEKKKKKKKSQLK